MSKKLVTVVTRTGTHVGHILTKNEHEVTLEVDMHGKMEVIRILLSDISSMIPVLDNK